jgi:hypothetical protein
MLMCYDLSMAAKTSKVLKVRYGKAQGKLAEDAIDLEAAREGLRQLQEHPESGVSFEEVKRRYGIK